RRDLHLLMYEVVHRGASMSDLSVLRGLIPVPGGDEGNHLEWIEAGVVHTSPARVASIGSGGALPLAEHRPPLPQVLPVRVDDVWIEAFVARHHSPDLVELVLRRHYA